MSQRAKTIYRAVPALRRRSYRRGKMHRRHKPKSRVPVLPLLGIGIGLADPIMQAVGGDFSGALAESGARIVGYNYQSKTTNVMYALSNFWLPVALGTGAHFGAKAIGLNKAIHKIPFVGKYVEL